MPNYGSYWAYIPLYREKANEAYDQSYDLSVLSRNRKAGEGGVSPVRTRNDKKNRALLWCAGCKRVVEHKSHTHDRYTCLYCGTKRLAYTRLPNDLAVLPEAGKEK